MQVDCPVSDWKLPGEHCVAAEAPVTFTNVPAAAGVHTDWPVLDANRPVGHGTEVVCPLALTNSLAKTGDRDTEARVMLDFGHSGSWLTLHQRGAPYFARRLDFGGLTVTQAISDGTRVPFEEAEEWKLEAGSDAPSMRVTPDSPEMQAVQSCMRTLGDELRRSFTFYRTMAPLPESFSLWLSGGTARLPGVAGWLAEALDVPVLVYNPLDVLGSDLRATPPGGPQFSLAYGLALRAA